MPPDIFQNLYAIGIFQGLLIAILLVCDKKNSPANLTLGIWSLLLALSFVGIFCSQISLGAASYLTAIHYFLPALYGPILYLLCRQATSDQTIALRDGIHVLPFIFCYLINLDSVYFLLMEHRFTDWFLPPSYQGSFTITVFYGQAFVYAFCAARVVVKHQAIALLTLPQPPASTHHS